MITCKEDLHNTWIKNDKGELRDLYISIAASFGIKNEILMSGLPFIGIFSEWGGCGFVGNTSELLFDQESRKQLTIKDLKKEKPKPTKFVKVEESIFDLKEEFEKGELYVSTCEGHYTQILGENGLFLAAFNNSIYRQVEIDWRESVVSIAPRGYGVSAWGEVDLRIDGSYSKEQALILANAIIESLTDKPE